MLLGGLIVLAWLAGVLVNYLSDVLPRARRASGGETSELLPIPTANAWLPRCQRCDQPYPWMKYILWPATCPACGKSRPARFGWVQISAVLAVAWFWNTPPSFLPYPLLGPVMIYFGVVIVIDLEHRLILHPVSLAGAVIAGGAGIFLHGWQQAIVGGLAGFSVMFGLYMIGVWLVRWMARWRGQLEPGDALGFGDVILGGVLGLLLGWPGIIIGVMLAIILGGAGSLLLVVRMWLSHNYRADAVIPYGPFLVASAILMLFFSQIF